MRTKYWKAVNRRVNHLVKTQGWPRGVALQNTRELFKAGRGRKFWRKHYEDLV